MELCSSHVSFIAIVHMTFARNWYNSDRFVRLVLGAEIRRIKWKSDSVSTVGIQNTTGCI